MRIPRILVATLSVAAIAITTYFLNRTPNRESSENQKEEMLFHNALFELIQISAFQKRLAVDKYSMLYFTRRSVDGDNRNLPCS